MSPLARGAVAIGVALLFLAGVAVVALRDDDAPIAGATPTPSPSPTLAPPSPEPVSPGPGPGPGEELEIFARIEEQVSSLRGLEPAEIGPPEVLSRDELAEELRASFEEDYPPEDREADNVTLRAMGLLEPDQDIGELQLQLLQGSVLGFYDDTDKRMVVVTDRGIDGEARITYAHEYTHALQDANFGLAPLELDAVGEDDRVMAALGLVEGDATVAMIVWAFTHDQEALAEAGQVTPPDLSGIPSWLVAALAWPYDLGARFVLEIGGGDPTSLDWSAVDDVYADPPASTEQIIRPEKYLAGEDPIEVEPIDLAGELEDGVGGGWGEVESTPIGEAFIGIWLEALGVAADEALTAGAGWGGDRLTVAADEDEQWILSWRLAWDTAADADEFAATYESVSGDLPFAAELMQVAETEVLIRHASSEELLAKLPPAS